MLITRTPVYLNERGIKVKKSFCITIIFLLILVCPFACFAFEAGDYISFGSYQGEPLIWRVTDVNNDNIYIISDKIISLKSLDSEDANWSTSDLRKWLNSSADNNATYNESGFLNSTNFSGFESTLFMPVVHETVINKLYETDASSGSEPMNYSNSVVVDEAKLSLAYKENVTDKVFLPGLEQISKLYSDKATFGVEYNMAMLTAHAALEGSDQGATVTKNWFYWTGDALSFSGDISRALIMTNTNDITYAPSYNSTVGVRPMCCIDNSSSVTLSGKGTENSPYIVTGIADESGTPLITFERNGTDINVSLYIQSNEKKVLGNFIIAGYDDENCSNLTSVKYSKLSVESGRNVISETLKIDDKTKFVRAYVWDSDLKPLNPETGWVVE